MLGDGLDLTAKLDAKGQGEGRVVLSPKPATSLDVTLTATPADTSKAPATAKVTVEAMNFDVTLSMPEDGSPAPGNMRCRLDLNPPQPDTSAPPDGTTPPPASGQYSVDEAVCYSFGHDDDDSTT
jgi:hypothetical protein